MNFQFYQSLQPTHSVVTREMKLTNKRTNISISQNEAWSSCTWIINRIMALINYNDCSNGNNTRHWFQSALFVMSLALTSKTDWNILECAETGQRFVLCSFKNTKQIIKWMWKDAICGICVFLPRYLMQTTKEIQSNGNHLLAYNEHRAKVIHRISNDYCCGELFLYASRHNAILFQ